MYTVLLPPDVNPIAVKYIISYNFFLGSFQDYHFLSTDSTYICTYISEKLLYLKCTTEAVHLP